ncbi:MAG: TlpA family protein disulfide reductase [Deltaproteobacteria bacterium]|nr:TlpA family protein disulfide reductase [Deltaproteobacteria bacterium]
MAPDFSLSDLSGQTISLEQHRGSVVLLDFWATWCGPCKMTVPLLAKLHEQYKDNGLVILGISVDDPQLIKDADLRNYKKMTQIDYPLMRFNQEIMEDYFSSGQIAIPTMFVIDRSGRIRDKIVGFQPDALEKSVAAVIR